MSRVVETSFWRVVFWAQHGIMFWKQRGRKTLIIQSCLFPVVNQIVASHKQKAQSPRLKRKTCKHFRPRPCGVKDVVVVGGPCLHKFHLFQTFAEAAREIKTWFQSFSVWFLSCWLELVAFVDAVFRILFRKQSPESNILFPVGVEPLIGTGGAFLRAREGLAEACWVVHCPVLKGSGETMSRRQQNFSLNDRRRHQTLLWNSSRIVTILIEPLDKSVTNLEQILEKQKTKWHSRDVGWGHCFWVNHLGTLPRHLKTCPKMDEIRARKQQKIVSAIQATAAKHVYVQIWCLQGSRYRYMISWWHCCSFKFVDVVVVVLVRGNKWTCQNESCCLQWSATGVFLWLIIFARLFSRTKNFLCNVISHEPKSPQHSFKIISGRTPSPPPPQSKSQAIEVSSWRNLTCVSRSFYPNSKSKSEDVCALEQTTVGQCLCP